MSDYHDHEPDRDRPAVRLQLNFSKTSDRVERAAIIDYANAHCWMKDHYECSSFSDPTKRYVVTEDGRCTCGDFTYRKLACQHVLACLASSVVWGIKWCRAARDAEELRERYDLHRDICREKNIPNQYMLLLDREFEKKLDELEHQQTMSAVEAYCAMEAL